MSERTEGWAVRSPQWRGRGRATDRGQGWGATVVAGGAVVGAAVVGAAVVGAAVVGAAVVGGVVGATVVVGASVVVGIVVDVVVVVVASGSGRLNDGVDSFSV